MKLGGTLKVVFSNQLLQSFFDEVYFKNILLIDWIKEVTNGKYTCNYVVHCIHYILLMKYYMHIIILRKLETV